MTDYIGHDDLTPVVQVLTKSTSLILDRWLERVSNEPFHLGRRERAISNHIPALFKALVQSLADDAPDHVNVHSTMESEMVKKAAGQHAETRRTQGLSVTEVISEIRMLRQETSRALLEDLRDGDHSLAILAADLALNDGFDGAICVAAEAVVQGLEREHREALAITVHDLKSPLAAIKASAQLGLRRSNASRTDIDGLLHRVVDGSDRVREIVDEALSAVQAGEGHQLNEEAVGVEQFLRNAISGLGEEARLRVTIEVAADVPEQVVWDVPRLRRVIENIVSNALKYAPQGPVIIAATAAPNEHLAITIKDRGIGLSAEDKRQLFARYYRSPEVIRMKIEGTGLGLYVAKATVEAHGGTLHVESPGPGKGTTFHILLPVTIVAGSLEQ
ncbi:MAG TPA: sensor histidine kinase [Chloroflexota bacterium]|nr:sensor histidine kinase [Chloroflexota bacterium]